MPEHRWLWRASVTRVVDGDTVYAVIDAGFNATRTERLRLLGTNCHELKGATREAGLAASDYTRRWIPSHVAGVWPLLIETRKMDAFGRYLADIWRVSDGRWLNADLIAYGHAVAVPRS